MVKPNFITINILIMFRTIFLLLCVLLLHFLLHIHDRIHVCYTDATCLHENHHQGTSFRKLWSISLEKSCISHAWFSFPSSPCTTCTKFITSCMHHLHFRARDARKSLLSCTTCTKFITSCMHDLHFRARDARKSLLSCTRCTKIFTFVHARSSLSCTRCTKTPCMRNTKDATENHPNHTMCTTNNVHEQPKLCLAFRTI